MYMHTYMYTPYVLVCVSVCVHLCVCMRVLYSQFAMQQHPRTIDELSWWQFVDVVAMCLCVLYNRFAQVLSCWCVYIYTHTHIRFWLARRTVYVCVCVYIYMCVYKRMHTHTSHELYICFRRWRLILACMTHCLGVFVYVYTHILGSFLECNPTSQVSIVT